MTNEAVVNSEQKGLGIALYTDGGNHKRNPGPIGSGVHGYLYHLNPNVGKMLKHDKVLFTAKGYLGKDNKDAAKIKSIKDVEDVRGVLNEGGNIVVSPHAFVNFSVSDAGEGTNNKAEILGMKTAMDFIQHYNSQYETPIEYAYIHSDSQYVINGLTQYLDKWKRMNWVKGDGNPVAGKENWMALDSVYQDVKDKVKVKINWVKGHAGNVGNVKADRLASQGAALSAGHAGKPIDLNDIQYVDGHEEVIDAGVNLKGVKSDAGTETDVVGNVKAKKEQSKSKALTTHPFLFSKRFIFNPLLHKGPVEYHETQWNNYFLLEPGDKIDDDFIGKEISDAAVVWVSLKEADPYMELVIESQRDWLERYKANLDIIVQGFLSDIHSKALREEMCARGKDTFHGTLDAVHNLFTANGKPITMVMNPVFLATRHIQRLDSMTIWAALWRERKAFCNAVDITHLFYTEDEKKGKIHHVLKPEIDNQMKSLKAKAYLSDTLHCKALTEEEQRQAHALEVTLSFGVDIPPRNALKKMEGMNPTVYLCTIPEGGDLFSYFVLIELMDTQELLIMQTTHAHKLLRVLAKHRK